MSATRADRPATAATGEHSTDQLMEQLLALRPTLTRMARHRLRNDAWADDAVSDTIVAAIEGIATVRQTSHLQSWVFAILRFKVFDAFRLRRRELPLSSDASGVPEPATQSPWSSQSDGSTPETHLIHAQFVDGLIACVRSLPARQRAVFTMSVWRELSIDEICHEMAITRTNAGVLLHRARRRVRKELAAAVAS